MVFWSRFSSSSEATSDSRAELKTAADAPEAITDLREFFCKSFVRLTNSKAADFEGYKNKDIRLDLERQIFKPKSLQEP